ncbi:hypothetical protein PC129_g14191 [Phytophthora cactorum]|uniref:Uncharacterized protein n=1 Tax=Phytophthora cactorum TaxID=29920 RepID=A0A8T1GWR9_9STRA|nr:hypothetical protein PC112_g2395 [Phytophthora cactorum]KAG2997773.1 hypothetical protein PC118_g1690 [Phytophthora cactorum]KAG3009818.1 hypothetical protein PC120_g15431 [Phytophthora cactorum]KAG3039205.1 hypothetical protein PC119_g2354 [Phytophthora cactorum]KAG3214908.1 hypothetical protein PC129_g14191 [Phytophthora cactorum]
MGSADVRENVPPPATDGGSWRSDLSDLQTTVCSDEEWVESAEETSSSASTSSKQHQSRENDHPRNDLDEYLKEYVAATYQSVRVRTNNKVAAKNKKLKV